MQARNSHHWNKTASALALAGIAFGGLSLASRTAEAHTYSITSTTMAITTKDKICSFPEAVIAINNNAAFDECPKPDASNNIISLKAGIGNYTISNTIGINQSVTIQSATSGQMVTLAQSSTLNSPPSTSNVPLINVNVASQTNAVHVTFQDIDFVGLGRNSVEGVAAGGNDTSDALVFTRCWIEKFDASGLDLIAISLTMTDSSVDSNSGSGVNSLGAAGISLEGDNASTYLSLTNTSVTRNKGYGIGLELQNGSNTLIVNSTISDNQGTGIALYPMSLTATPATIDIYDSTIAYNTCPVSQESSGNDCGISNPTVVGLSETVSLFGTVIAANSFADGTSSDYSGNLQLLWDGLLETSDDATIFNFGGVSETDYGLTNLDPTLRNNGGAGQRPPLTHKPLDTSICVDFSPDQFSLPSGEGALDERHKTRPYAFRGKSSHEYDVGAVELQKGE